MHLLLGPTDPGKTEAFLHAARNFNDLHLETSARLPTEAEARPATGSLEVNAQRKALALSAQLPGLILLAEDSGLAVRRLGGAPGVHSYDYADQQHFVHAGTRQERNIACLLDRSARLRYRDVSFFCFLAAARDGVLLATGIGEVQGSLIDAPRGTGGSEYDAIFDILELGQTLAQLDDETYQAFTPHGRALRHLMLTLARKDI